MKYILLSLLFIFNTTFADSIVCDYTHHTLKFENVEVYYDNADHTAFTFCDGQGQKYVVGVNNCIVTHDR